MPASAAPERLPVESPAGRPDPRQAPPRLRLVPAPGRARRRVPFVAVCMAVLAASLLLVLVLNTTMAQGEYTRYKLAASLAQSAQQQQELSAQLDQAASPALLAQRAQALGMVPSTVGGYVRLADGAVLGTQP
jgi:hypothetical protein